MSRALAKTLMPAAALLMMASADVMADPNFKVPFVCDQTWAYKHYNGEQNRALDFNAPEGTPVLAAADGWATLHPYSSHGNGAGNYVQIDHGNGWVTWYFHLKNFSLSSNQQVSQGQQIGTVGNTGNSFGAHLHYEQLYNWSGQDVRFNGVSLAPYPVEYTAGKTVTSDNGCSGSNPPPTAASGKYWVDTYATANGHATPGGSVSGYLNAGTSYVYCREWGPQVTAGSYYNHWWLKTDLDVGPADQWVSALYLSNWGNDEARDNDGRDLPECDYLPVGAIADAYYAMGGIDSPLGLPTSAEQDAQLDGRVQQFEHGIILWHADTGAYPVYGDILTHFQQTGEEARWGFPTTEERDAAPSPVTGAAGRYQYFQQGLLLWTPQTGAHAVHGAIHAHFANNGREAAFGYPETDEVPYGNGVKQTFEKAVFYWDPTNWVQVQWR